MSNPSLQENERSLSAPDVRRQIAATRVHIPPPILRHSSSWPPAFSVYHDGDLTATSERKHAEPLFDLDLAHVSFADQPIARSTESKSALSTGKSTSSSTSPSSEVTLELKKEGFRASVSKRWSITKHILHDKARLYREYYRAYQQIRHKSEDPTTIDLRKDHPDKKDSQPTTPASPLPKRDKEPGSKKEQHKTKPDKSSPKGKITNSPHELSARYWQPDADEHERGRQRGRAGTVNSSHAIYPKGFSSRGVLLVGSEPRLKRKSRTASGHRHAWQEPSLAIVPVSEESLHS